MRKHTGFMTVLVAAALVAGACTGTADPKREPAERHLVALSGALPGSILLNVSGPDTARGGQAAVTLARLEQLTEADARRYLERATERAADAKTGTAERYEIAWHALTVSQLSHLPPPTWLSRLHLPVSPPPDRHELIWAARLRLALPRPSSPALSPATGQCRLPAGAHDDLLTLASWEDPACPTLQLAAERANQDGRRRAGARPLTWADLFTQATTAHLVEAVLGPQPDWTAPLRRACATYLREQDAAAANAQNVDSLSSWFAAGTCLGGSAPPAVPTVTARLLVTMWSDGAVPDTFQPRGLALVLGTRLHRHLGIQTTTRIPAEPTGLAGPRDIAIELIGLRPRGTHIAVDTAELTGLAAAAIAAITHPDLVCQLAPDAAADVRADPRLLERHSRWFELALVVNQARGCPVPTSGLDALAADLHARAEAVIAQPGRARVGILYSARQVLCILDSPTTPQQDRALSAAAESFLRSMRTADAWTQRITYLDVYGAVMLREDNLRTNAACPDSWWTGLP